MVKHSDSTSNGESKYAGLKSQAEDAHGAAALAELDGDLLRDTVVSVLQAGDAILIGQTRDGGAVAMQLYSGDSIDKLYCATLEDLQDTLQKVLNVSKA